MIPRQGGDVGSYHRGINELMGGRNTEEQTPQYKQEFPHVECGRRGNEKGKHSEQEERCIYVERVELGAQENKWKQIEEVFMFYSILMHVTKTQ